jgi:hypothetical protein
LSDCDYDGLSKQDVTKADFEEKGSGKGSHHTTRKGEQVTVQQKNAFAHHTVDGKKNLEDNAQGRTWASYMGNDKLKAKGEQK